jgi:hypothetical protein
MMPHFEPHFPDFVALKFHFSGKNKLTWQYHMNCPWPFDLVFGTGQVLLILEAHSRAL